MGHWENAGLPDDFDGLVRLFPLPNLVLFPHVIQALHIFEPRYCEMLSDSLESDHLITMALLTPGWEMHVDRNPAIGDVVCIGRIVSHTPTDDGRHNILLAGIHRARIVSELDAETPFRQARVELLYDYVPPDSEGLVEQYRDSLLGVFRSLIPHDASGSKTFGELLTRQLPLGILTDIVGYAVSLPSDVKLRLLGETNIVARYEILMSYLGSQDEEDPSFPLSNPGNPTPPPRAQEFPPKFSDN